MNSITYFQLLSTYNKPYLIALRATKEKLKASVSEILTEAFFISDSKGYTKAE